MTAVKPELDLRTEKRDELGWAYRSFSGSGQHAITEQVTSWE